MFSGSIHVILLKVVDTLQIAMSSVQGVSLRTIWSGWYKPAVEVYPRLVQTYNRNISGRVDNLRNGR